MMARAAALRAETPAGTRVAGTSFDDAYPSLYRSAYRVAYRLLGGREESADIAQEACARAYARWSRVGAYERPQAWAARVAGNLAIDRLRRGRTAARHAAAAADCAAPDGARVDLQRALLALPRRQREVVLLRYVADQSEEATAVALGCSVGAVKAYASRGLAALRAALGEGDA